MELTQERLKEVLSYNPESGIFRWKINKSNKCKIGNIAGCNYNCGYQIIMIDKKRILSHRLAFLYMTGSMPNKEIDHINHDRIDNRWENLREVNSSINAKNQSIYKNNKTSISGVRWSKRNKKFQTYISINKQKTYLYYGNDFFEACCRRKSAENKYGYHTNHGKEK